VVPVSHEIKGKVPDLYVSLKPGIEASDEIAAQVQKNVIEDIGSIAKCAHVWIVPDMPKTRSGKIMRRVLGSLSNGRDVGDVTTLANPQIVTEIHEIMEKKR